ncbi:MAG TPA: PEP/pyruvate-binding domain-containing protein [Thermoanaerobaculia bacterium]|nr:PEP/pyruvate-binding domain-containing protein [Thermoanaerobaculia bacterium]
MSWILEFGDRSARDVGSAGGKGSSLARLFQAGFPVPAGLIVTADADRAFRDEDPELKRAVAGFDFARPEVLREQCERIRARLIGRPLPPPLARELSERLPPLLALGPVAVRSSSTLEDLAGAAFAGQHDTFLNRATIQSVLEAVRRCFASLWEDRAVRYRRERGYGQEGASMAVAIQSMVGSESAGVAFTVDPITGDAGRLLINSAWGLGETVVSGEGDVDQFVLDRKTGRVVEARIAEKTRAIVGASDGTRVVELSGDRAKAASLSEGELQGLWKLSIDAERLAGFPQDVEWAIAGGRVFLLQSRPITRLPDRWTRDESAERFPNVVTPLTWDYASEAFHASLSHSLRLMGLPPFSGHWFDRFDGYIYGNQTAVRLFTAGFPPFESLEELRRLLPDVRRRYPWVESLPVSWARDLDRYLLRLGALESIDTAGMTEAELGRLVDSIANAGREYFLPNIAISLTHALLHLGLFRFLSFVAAPAEAAKLYDELMGFCETKTSLVNTDLQALARLARRDAALEQLLRRTDRRAIWEERRLAGFPAFEASFARFLEDHGHREVDFDAFHPTWSGQPWVVLENIRLLLEQPSLPDPASRSAELRETQQLAEQRLAELVPGDLRFFAAELVRLCRAYTALDDIEHYQTTRLNTPFRRTLMELGSRLTRRGVLEAPEEVFFLRRRTLEGLLHADVSQAQASGEARFNAAEYRRQSKQAPPWIRGETPVAAASGALRGLPGSPGVAEGPVFRVHSVEDFARFPSGAVLVARTTNPAWTPLFYSARAVVTESGGPLSHGAVTAREVGIPAVMAVRGALEALPDGARVRVNGTAGSVEKLPG